MQPPINPGINALTFSSYIFTMTKESFDKVVETIDENIQFTADATLVDQNGTVTKQDIALEGKEKVVQVLASRIFNITTSIKLPTIGVQEIIDHPNDARVDFKSTETKNEESGPVTYDYMGQFYLQFKETDQKLVKICRLNLVNTRTIKTAESLKV